MKHSAIAATMIFALGAGTASAATTSTATKVTKTTPAVPSATATFTGETVAVGIAFTWGKGVLTFKGKTYPFKVDGLSAVGAGAEKITGTGEVYHLASVADFPGTYASAGGGATMGKMGRGSASLKNNKGVVIEFKAKETGLEVNLAAGGVTIAMTPRK
jgi:hypothetical protein